MVTAEDIGTLLSLLDIDRLYEHVQVLVGKINYISKFVAMVATYSELSTRVGLVF